MDWPEPRRLEAQIRRFLLEQVTEERVARLIRTALSHAATTPRRGGLLRRLVRRVSLVRARKA